MRSPPIVRMNGPISVRVRVRPRRLARAVPARGRAAKARERLADAGDDSPSLAGCSRTASRCAPPGRSSRPSSWSWARSCWRACSRRCPRSPRRCVLAVAARVAIWGMRSVPDASCGCFGPAPEPVSARTSSARACSPRSRSVAAFGGGAWTDVFGEPRALVLARSPSASRWSPATPELRTRRRLRSARGPAGLLARDPPRRRAAGSPVERRRAAPAQRAVGRRARPTSPPTRRARSGATAAGACSAIPADYEGEPATAVFALYLGRSRAPTASRSWPRARSACSARSRRGGT